MVEGCYFLLSSSFLRLQQPATDLRWGMGWGPPARGVDVTHSVCEGSGWRWAAALPVTAPLLLRFHAGLWQRAGAGSWGISLLWAEVECDHAATAAASAHTGRHHCAGTSLWFCSCCSCCFAIANEEPTQRKCLVIPGSQLDDHALAFAC